MIAPGEDKFFSDTTRDKDASRYVRVSWEESSPLSLTVFPPDGELGPFLDTSDGREDRTIFLKIGGDDGISPGRWFYRVQNPKDGNPEMFSIETWEE